jgi:SAM-dependent methyltransferase
MNPSPDPFPSKEEISRGYDQIPAEKFMPQKFHRLCVRLVRPRLAAQAHVVDLGCGQGTLLEALNDLPLDLRLAACDLSPGLVGNTRKRVPAADVRVADIEDLPFPEATFDAAFATEVMEHLESPLKALQQAHRILKPGGWLLVSLPNRDWFRFDEYIEQRSRFQPVDDHFYRVAEMEDFLNQAGFRPRQIRGGENLYFGGGLPRLLERAALLVFPALHRRMKRMILISQKPSSTAGPRSS